MANANKKKFHFLTPLDYVGDKRKQTLADAVDEQLQTASETIETANNTNNSFYLSGGSEAFQKTTK